jgi:alkylhydroperoxidase/carboxymuconolactone decarboxylase family protein YurZ
MNTRNYRKEIDEFEARYRYDSTYMRELLEYSPAGYAKFDNFMPLAGHREKLDPETYWVARLAAMQVEDCGDCLQLNVRMAIEDDVSRAVIESVLKGGKTLPDDLRDLYEFAVSVAAHNSTDNGVGGHIEARFDKGALLELALCIATAKVFPTIKRTLGYTRSCSLVEIEV